MSCKGFNSSLTGDSMFELNYGNTNTYLTLGTTTDGICTFTTSYVLTTSPSIQEKLVDNTKYKFYIYVYDPGIKKSDGKDEYSWNYAEEAEYEAETNAKPSLMSSDFIFTVNKAVYDGKGNNVFESSSEVRTPAFLWFEVPNDLYSLLKTAEFAGAKLIPIPRNASYSAEQRSPEIDSEFIETYIRAKGMNFNE